MSWSQFITQRYDEWRAGKYGNAASIAEFARQFGAPHQIVLGWMKKGSQPPRKRQYADALIAVYGEEYPEIYELLDIERPKEIPLDQVPLEVRSGLSFALDRVAAAFEAGVDLETDEGLKQLISILEDAGFVIKAIRKE